MTQRILLLLDNRKDSNWGSQATTTALVQMLQTAHPNAEIRGLDASAANNIRQFRSLATSGLIKHYSGKSSLVGAVSSVVLAKSLKQFERWPDLIVMNGEGTLHSTSKAVAWLALAKIAQAKLRAPLHIVNSSFWATQDSFLSLYRNALKNVPVLACREPLSFEFLTRLGLNSVQAADAAFSLPAPTPSPKVDAYISHHVGNSRFAIITGSPNAAHWSAEHIAALFDSIRLRCLIPILTASTPTDRELWARIPSEAPSFDQREFSFEEFRYLVSRAHLVVGGRYHPMIFAAMSGVPFVPFRSNTYKIEGLLRLLNSDQIAHDPADTSGIESSITSALENWDQVSHDLSINANRAAALARLNVQI